MTLEEVDKCTVKRVLDTGATKNIIYLKYFKEMRMNGNHLKTSSMVLEGFTEHKIHVKGTVRMQVTLGTDDQMKTKEASSLRYRI